MEIIDSTLGFVKFVGGEIRVGAALGHYGRYMTTGDREHLIAARQSLSEAEGTGAHVEYARDFITRYCPRQ